MADIQSQGAPTEQAREKVQEVAQNVQQQTRSRVSEQVDQRSTQVGEQVGTAAQALRQSADQLRQQGSDTPARFIEQAAGRMESAGTWLRDSDGDGLLSDVEDFGRRNPWIVVAAGVTAGFAASRLLKASSERRRPDYVGGYQRYGARTGNGTTRPTPGYTGTGYERAPAPAHTESIPPATSPAPTAPGATTTTTFGDRS